MKRLTVLVLVLLFLGIVALFWWQNGLLAANSSDRNPKIFVVGKGQGVKDISYNLKKEGLIRDPIVFFLLVKEQNLDKQIQAGDFRLNPSMSAQEVATNLTHGTLDIWITIPEGVRADEIADLLKAKIPSYNETWRQTLNQNEGYLFPATYLIQRDATVSLVVSLLKNNFDTKFESVKNLKKVNISDSDVIKIASIIEREAVFAEDRPIVASVLINRLDIGMPLGSDPTIQYAVGFDQQTKSWWKKDLTVDDLAINSPYNTRKVAGLPPTPISNPGLSSIKAALNPANTDYLYFYSDSKGHLHFGKTLQEHEANIKKYSN
ncbi:MAG TPA: endolytic transglycosylase MltG [Candidatus Sulfotelmatobacter sp.]|nr:endolytic transglycosylase MltG [Candidatus Sulfotelmatobacter sp.]